MKWLRRLARFVKELGNWLEDKTMEPLREIFLNKYEHKKDPLTHHKPRPNGIDGIIIHSMAQRIKGHGTASAFLDKIGLSAHYLIETDGVVIEHVPPTEQAFHAGKSKFGRQENLNTSFIGIEVLVKGEHDYTSFLEAIKEDVYTPKQYDSTAVMCGLLCTKFDIPHHRIVRHSDVSGPDVRDTPKHDPGEGFDWDHFKLLTKELISQLEADEDEGEENLA